MPCIDLGNSYVKANETDKAMSIYDRLTTEYTMSSFVQKDYCVKV